uniref:Nucleolar protein 14 n=1 Tax=Peronospora matthiolae TaxID=2874970 RepID=A0AAV1UTV1_9STRA
MRNVDGMLESKEKGSQVVDLHSYRDTENQTRTSRRGRVFALFKLSAFLARQKKKKKPRRLDHHLSSLPRLYNSYDQSTHPPSQLATPQPPVPIRHSQTTPINKRRRVIELPHNHQTSLLFLPFHSSNPLSQYTAKRHKRLASSRRPSALRRLDGAPHDHEAARVQRQDQDSRPSARPRVSYQRLRVVARSSSSRGHNPFDQRCNNATPKYEVLGRRVKGASRNVAAARAAAEQKRRKTLGVEFRARKKSNVFKDKRLGEQDPTLSLEDKMMARFQTERKRQMRHAGAFALHDSDQEGGGGGEEEEEEKRRYGGLVLTHRGARITDGEEEEEEVGQGGRDVSEDDRSKTEEDWKMDREIVDTLHFGGGGAAASAVEEGGSTLGVRKTHKEVMQEVMMKAKLYKAERQKNKSAQEEATDQLDAGFAGLRDLLEFRPTRANGKEVQSKAPMDEFDTLTREFAFEAKVKATERRMSPEEAAAKDRDRLKELEKKRVARMHGADGDDSDDGGGERGGTRKGRKGKKKDKRDKTSEAIVVPPTDDDLMDDYVVDDRFAHGDEDGEEDVEAGDEDHDMDDESDEVDSEEESEEELVDDEGRASDEKGKADGVEKAVDLDEDEEVDGSDDELQKRLDDAEEAAQELPFVFTCPESPDELVALFKQHARNSPLKRGLILERIVTYYNPRLSVENKTKMKTFFAVMARQFLVFAARYAAHKQDLDSLAKSMYTLAQQMGDTAGIVARELLAQLYKRLHKRTSTCAWPSLPELLLFKALTSIFPTSDLRHNVISPMETLLGSSLARGTIECPQEAVQALFAASLSLDMTRSKVRFMPELVTFLTRHLRAFVVPSTETSSGHDTQQETSHWLRRDLFERGPVSTCAATKDKNAPIVSRLSLSSSSSSGSSQVLTSLLVLLQVASAQYAQLPSFDELFYPLYLLLHALAKQLETAKGLGREVLSSKVHTAISLAHSRLAACWQQREPLRLQRFAPTGLPTFAPHFDENYTVRKDKMAPKDTAQLKQLQRQVKRARKGAARELRRDAEFLHREKQKEEQTRVEAKAEKQKEIRRWLDEQNATFNQQVRKGGNMLKGGGSARGPAPRARALSRQ